MSFGNDKRLPSQKEYLLNITEKENDPGFTGDMEALLRPDALYNSEDAFNWLKESVISKM
jgi:hypothetical protein